MNTRASIPAVDHSVLLPISPEQAFALFTQRMGLWWPFAGHSCSGEAGQDVVFEPGVGGKVVERARDGRSFTWGTLSQWDPPHGFTMSWHPGLPLHEATRLQVLLRAEGSGTRVRVLHDGWEARGADAALKRDQYHGGWPRTLEALASRAQAEFGGAAQRPGD
jgi:hypothetical protein